MIKFFIGLDLGQAHDYTALCVVEKIDDSKTTPYHVRYLERFPLQTTYPAIVERVAELMESPELRDE